MAALRTRLDRCRQAGAAAYGRGRVAVSLLVGGGRWLLCLILLTFGGTILGSTEAVAPTDVVFMNRPIYTMRAVISNSTPEMRAARVLTQLRSLDEHQLALPVERTLLSWHGEKGIVLRAGDVNIMTVFASDLDPESNLSLEAVADETQRRLAEAMRARLDLLEPKKLLIGFGFTAAGLLAMVSFVWVLTKVGRSLADRLQTVVQTSASSHKVFGIDWSEYAVGFLVWVVRLIKWSLIAVLFFVWLSYSLRQFTATEPLAGIILRPLWDGLWELLLSSWRALPELLLVLVILMLARGANSILAAAFSGVERGQFKIPGIHQDTARATRRISVVAVWGLALVTIYPYIPGSQSDAFKALSLLIGFIATLGSTGIASQLMNGLVLVYSRALRVGDFVRIGEVEGIVTELGPLSIKLVTYRRDELTLPNSTVISGMVTNYTKLEGVDGALASTRVTIGYDTPWRQVYALLEEAARHAAGVSSTPKPYVLQRGLSDFYVEYELLVVLENPFQRALALSRLHEAIQDAFNAHGVQIMSPHFEMQPYEKVVPKPENWPATPA